MVPYQSQVGYLRKLESLKLRDNLLSGSLPTELGRLNATQTGPYLFNNSFSGTLPTGRIPDVLIEASAATAENKMRIFIQLTSREFFLFRTWKPYPCSIERRSW